MNLSTLATSKLHLFAIFIFAAIGPFILLSAPVIAQQVAVEWQLTPSQVGTFFFVELGVMSLATIPAYFWAKKIAFKQAALISALIFIIGNIVSIFAKSFDMLLIARAIAALGGGSLMIITMTSCSLTSHPDRTYGLWILGQVVLGALALFFLPQFFPFGGLKIAFGFMIVVAFIALPFYRYFADFIIEKKPAVADAASSNKLLGILSVVATLIFYIAIGGVWTFISSIGAHAKIDMNFVNSILAISTIVGILGCFLPSILGGKINRKFALIFGYGLFFISLIMLLNQISNNNFVFAVIAFKFTWMFTIPFILATVGSLDSSGKLMNTVNLAIGAGLALGPVVAGEIIENTGNFNLLIGYTIAVFAVSFIVIYLCNLKKATPITV
ncbi:MFS transporter [Acinetobacter wanghuae]|uniref:MFS transporter n=1 Tax=Acinetobacter wanghuae TaxID=2662362 RepID=UPI003AF4E087